MDGKIAIEPNLNPVKKYLTGKGYNVDSINFNERSSQNLNGYDAFVVTGLNTNFLGMNDTKTKAVVINADGMTPEEVEKEIQNLK